MNEPPPASTPPATAAKSPAIGAAHLSISPTPVNQIAPLGTHHSDSSCGAVLSFEGEVRGIEDGRPIRGIRYSAYLPMAIRELEKLGISGKAKFPDHRLLIHHVLGFVAAGEASVVISVATPHSALAFEITRWYLQELKTRIPIWKEPIFE